MIDWWWAYLALGAFVGFFSGLLGIGGGSAMVPVLAFVFAAKGFAPDHVVHLALGTGISTMLFTSVASVRSHHRRSSVNWRVVARDDARGARRAPSAARCSRASSTCGCSASRSRRSSSISRSQMLRTQAPRPSGEAAGRSGDDVVRRVHRLRFEPVRDRRRIDRRAVSREAQRRRSTRRSAPRPRWAGRSRRRARRATSSAGWARPDCRLTASATSTCRRSPASWSASVLAGAVRRRDRAPHAGKDAEEGLRGRAVRARDDDAGEVRLGQLPS